MIGLGNSIKILSCILLLAALLSPTTSAMAQTSSDGSTLTAPAAGQSLTTSQGTFSFGASGYPGGYQLLVNGAWTGTGSAVEYQVTNGQIYVQNNAGQWYSWTGTNWTGPIPTPVESVTSTSPPSTTPPPASATGCSGVYTQLTTSGTVTMPSPTCGYWAATQLQETMPPVSSVVCPATTYFSSAGPSLELSATPGTTWMGPPPGIANVTLTYGENSAKVWCDGASWHIDGTP